MASVFDELKSCMQEQTDIIVEHIRSVFNNNSHYRQVDHDPNCDRKFAIYPFESTKRVHISVGENSNFNIKESGHQFFSINVVIEGNPVSQRKFPIEYDPVEAYDMQMVEEIKIAIVKASVKALRYIDEEL